MIKMNDFREIPHVVWLKTTKSRESQKKINLDYYFYLVLWCCGPP